jgi:hypothetical protein
VLNSNRGLLPFGVTALVVAGPAVKLVGGLGGTKSLLVTAGGANTQLGFGTTVVVGTGFAPTVASV